MAREFNVSLFADSQTFNLASLGLAEDSNIRNNLNIISQGLISIDEDGNEQGGFEVIQSIIRNPYIFPSEEVRRVISIEVEKQMLLSKVQHTPIILSTAGKPKAGLLPNLLEYKGKNIFDSPIHPKGEFTLSISSPLDEAVAEGLTATDALPEPLRTIWKYAKTQGDWVMVRDIVRKDYAVLKGKNTQFVIECCMSLAEQGYGEVDLTVGKARFKAD